MQEARILVIDDDADVLLSARLLLKRHFSTVDMEKNPEKIPFLLHQNRYDAIILDMNFDRDLSSGREGLHWLQRILSLDPAAGVIFITAYGAVELAVQAMKAGAANFVLKPWNNERLVEMVAETIALRRQTRIGQTDASGRATAPTVTPTAQETIIGEAMQPVLALVAKVAPTDANVLLTGENGTGKDLVAQAIHAQSQRQNGPFVRADVGSLTESLFESELFGHVKGAFTDARADRKGRFEEAHGGTIFLDEIANLNPTQQTRLLTVLQQRHISRVGSNKPIPVDVRVISATNADLGLLTTERIGTAARFRPDLLYRLNTIEIRLPPLRDRPDDVEPLAYHFMRHYAHRYHRPVQRLSPALLRQLKKYDWPGNVRELQHAMERGVILSTGPMLDTDSFRFDTEHPKTPTDSLPLDEMERQLIRQAMHKHQGRISEVARELGLSRQALYRRLEKYNM